MCGWEGVGGAGGYILQELDTLYLITFKTKLLDHPKQKLRREGPFTGRFFGVPLPEPVFLNVYGAQESIPRNEFRQPM